MRDRKVIYIVDGSASQVVGGDSEKELLIIARPNMEIDVHGIH
jgi:hypothetical protein